MFLDGAEPGGQSGLTTLCWAVALQAGRTIKIVERVMMPRRTFERSVRKLTCRAPIPGFLRVVAIVRSASHCGERADPISRLSHEKDRPLRRARTRRGNLAAMDVAFDPR